jgi:hypothetical protein
MDTSRSEKADRPRHGGRGHGHYAALMWIAVLLASWVVIVQWKMVPELINATMAALP